MTTCKKYVFPKAMEPLQPLEVPVPKPEPEQVLIKVAACGVCHSDYFAQLGALGGGFPLCPGHEVVGTIAKVGSGKLSQLFAPGDRVGVGWHGGHCYGCEACTEGDFVCCEKQKITGILIDGGYTEYMVAEAHAVARIPDGMEFEQAAPLLCAGVTTFNALRHNPGKTGGVVAVQGLGGLGHLGVQFAAKMGYTVVAVSRSKSKEEEAKSYGAHHYIATAEEDAAEALQKLGGASVCLTTVTDAAAMGPMIQGLGRSGTLVVLGATPGQIPVGPFDIISKRKAIRGHPSGDARDSEDCLKFAHLHGVKVKTVVYPFSEAQQGYEAMLRGEYRVVLKL